jgi:hypothetical protein
MPPKGSKGNNAAARRKVFKQSHTTFPDQSATTSTWTRLTAGTSSGSVHFTTEKVAVGLEPPQKRRRTLADGQGQPSFSSTSTSHPSSTSIADSDSPSTSELATGPDGNLKKSAPAIEKPTTPIKPHVSLSKPPLRNSEFFTYRLL